MRTVNGMGSAAVVVCALVSISGCASLDDYRRAQALNRNLAAEKQGLESELDALRSSVVGLQSRVQRCEGDLGNKDSLLMSVRRENSMLDQSRKDALTEVERLARQPVGDIIINESKLPAQLDNALKRFADTHPSAVIYDAERGTVKWQSDLVFALGSDVVKQSSMDSLRQFSSILNSPAASGFEVIVVGHTDNQPIKRQVTRDKHPTNWHLSAHRAIAVGNVLQQASYSPGKIAVMGCGEYRPIASNANNDGRNRNRRVEIFLVPSGTIAHAAATGPSMPADSRAARQASNDPAPTPYTK